MIHFDRSKITPPAVLQTPRMEEARRAAERAFPGRHRPASQQRFEFESFWYREARAAFTQALFGKCAYCETRVAAGELLDMEHFRPIRSVAEDPKHPGYWWLAYEWDNLLGACRNCNSRKGNRFPVESEARRAFLPEELSGETKLLLDPGADDPSQHLVFNPDGTVGSETTLGQTSIAVFNLNRSDLVRARKRRADEIGSLIASLPDEASSEALERLRALTEPASDFAALGRQLIRPFLAKSGDKEVAETLPETWEGENPIVSPAHRKRVKQSFRAFEVSQSSYSLDDEAGRDTFRLQRRTIEAIHLRNFKSVGDLQLEFAASPEKGSNWLMLLGENGTGKSSVLQAVALTLMGTDSFVRLATEGDLKLEDLIRRGAKKATVSVKLSGFVAPHTMTLEKGRVVLQAPNGEECVLKASGGKLTPTGAALETPTVLLGYGATRLLRHRDDERYGLPHCRIDNLFEPLKPLLNADRWLLGLSKARFDEVAIVLKDILDLDPHATLVRHKGKVLVDAGGTAVALRQLSDGYQSVVAMSVDILEVAIRLWPQAGSAEGIVLLDEIGSHLHPRWRMRIVESLRKALPRLQFLVTTHEPLCLRGIGKGEVVVLRRDEGGRVEAIKDLPSPGDFRVDQLLTSEFFGLDSTTDPEAEALFDEYYALLALPERTPEQAARRDALEDALKDRRYVGATPREQLMFEAIDRLLARQRHGERLSAPQLKDAAVAEISRIWDES